MGYAARALFFRASDLEGGADIPEILRSLARKNVHEREISVNRDVVIRLERFNEDGDFIEGEFCRKQVSDLPPAAGPQGLNQILLGAEQGLGYLAAFRYHIPTRCIMLERNKMSASSIRLSLYLKKINPASTFTFSEVVNADVWDRFRDGTVRRLKVGFANPENFEALEGPGMAVLRSASTLAAAYRGLTVNLEIGVGHDRDASLQKGPVRAALKALIRNRNNGPRTVQVTLAEDDGTHMLDFLGDQLKYEEIIDYDGNDIIQRYNRRRDFLREGFRGKLPYLVELYG